MRAFVLTGPGEGAVRDVPAPRAEASEVVVDVERVGLCGTDVEFFTGDMAYLHQGHAAYPMRLGHEWAGTVAEVGADVDPGSVGRRVTGDTMLGDGTCRRCRRGHQHVCADRQEVGIRGGRPGALVEPGGNALRAAEAAAVGPGDRALVLGPGTIGLLTAMFLRAGGAEVHLLGRADGSLDVARGLGFAHAWTAETLPRLPFDAVVDASNAAHLPALAPDLVEPAGRAVYIGLAGRPSTIDTRTLALTDVTAVGILSASPGLADTVAAYAAGVVDPRPLVAVTVGLEQVAAVLAGERIDGAGPGPKAHVDPRR